MLLAAMILFTNIACMRLVAMPFYVLLLLRLVFVNVFYVCSSGLLLLSRAPSYLRRHRGGAARYAREPLKG